MSLPAVRDYPNSMKLIIPVLGMIFVTASCCCLGDNPIADNLPKPVQPLQTATGPGVPDVGIPAMPPGEGGQPGHEPVDPSPGAPPPPQPSTPPSTSPPPVVGAVPATAASGTHEGVLTTGSSRLVVLATTGGKIPPVGATGTLSKWVSRKIMGADVTMWLNIANVEVTAVDDKSVTLSVKEVTFDATVNGKKVDPFEEGVKTQLEWTK